MLRLRLEVLLDWVGQDVGGGLTVALGLSDEQLRAPLLAWLVPPQSKDGLHHLNLLVVGLLSLYTPLLAVQLRYRIDDTG